MKTQLFTVMAVLSVMGASTAPEQRDQREMNLLATLQEQGPMAAAAARPFPFSDPHTVEHGARDLETSICSTEFYSETQIPVSAAPTAETSSASDDTGAGTKGPAMTDCVTSVAPPAPSPSASTPTNPSQPNEVGDSNDNSSVSPCPGSAEESGPASSSGAPEAGFGGESAGEAEPAPTEAFSFPGEAEPAPTEAFSFPGEGQMAPTEPCDQVVSASAASGAAKQALTTVVVQPVEQKPSVTESPAAQSPSGTSPVQASAAYRLWSVGGPSTVFAFGLLGGWLAV